MGSISEADLQPFRELAERFARKELESKVLPLDDYPYTEFNNAAVQAAGEVGLLKAMVPESYGGIGQGMPVLCQILTLLAQTDASFAAVIFINTMAQTALLQWGSQALVDKYIQSPLMAFPAYDLPSDLPRDLTAEKKGDRFEIKGKMDFLPLSPVAEALILPVQMKGKDGIAFFLVDARAKGVTISDPVLSLGLRNCPVADVELDGVDVPQENLLCVSAEKEYPFLAAYFRPAATALTVGVVDGSYQAAKAYAKDRYQAGKVIIDHDQVRLLLANLAVIAESGKTLVKSMAQAAEDKQSRPLSDAGFILLSEQASRATSDGVQVLGGYGYIQDYGQEKRMRDAKQIESIFGAAPAKRLEMMQDILQKEQ